MNRFKFLTQIFKKKIYKIICEVDKHTWQRDTKVITNLDLPKSNCKELQSHNLQHLLSGFYNTHVKYCFD